MKKNVAGQKIGAQMINSTDGSAFTGSVTVAVTIDADVQTTGSVGAGACAHEGLGYHTYAPSQAETNGELCAFTFHGTGAINTTVQVYTVPANPGLDIADAVWDEILGGHVVPGSTGVALDNAAGGGGSGGATAAEIADAVWDEATTSHTIPGTFGEQAKTDIDTILINSGSGGTVNTNVAAIKTKTDSLTFTQPGQVDANIQRINDVTITGNGSSTPFGV